MTEFIFEQHEILRVSIHASSYEEAEELLQQSDSDRFVLSRKIDNMLDKFLSQNETTLKQREDEITAMANDWKEREENG